jgi:hypothetical protein
LPRPDAPDSRRHRKPDGALEARRASRDRLSRLFAIEELREEIEDWLAELDGRLGYDPAGTDGEAEDALVGLAFDLERRFARVLWDFARAVIKPEVWVRQPL